MIWFGVLGEPSDPSGVAYIGNVGSSADLISYTFASQSIGAAAADREIIVTIGYIASIQRTISSASIAGVTATIVEQIALNASPSVGSAIIRATVPTGTTGNIVINFSNLVRGCRIGIFRWTGKSSTTPHDTLEIVAATTIAGTIDIPAAGFLISTASVFTGPLGFTGNTEIYEASTQGTGKSGAGLSTGMSAQTNRPVGATIPAGETATYVAASFL